MPPERDTLLLKTILDQDIGTIANIIQAASELDRPLASNPLSVPSLYTRLSAAYYELTNKDPAAENDLIGLNPLFISLEAMRAEEEIECAHCGNVPDGTITIDTPAFDRYHRIYEMCAAGILEWL